MYTSDWKIWKGIFLRWHCSDVRYLHLTCHLFVFVQLNSSQCHFILPGFPHLPQHKPTSEVIEMEMKREKKNLMEKYFYPPHPMSMWMAVFSIHYVSPWRHHATATVLCFKKLKEQRKEKLMCFHLFCLFDESEAGPIIQYIMKCGDYIFFLSFFAKCEYSTYSICGTRECYVLLTQKMLMLRT